MDTNLDWKPIRRGTEMLLISFRLNHSFAAQSKAHPQYYIRGLYTVHWNAIIKGTGMFVYTIPGYLDSRWSVFFIRCILVLVTCFVVALNSQFARPAPRHSSSKYSGWVCCERFAFQNGDSVISRRHRTHEDARLHGVGRHLPPGSLYATSGAHKNNLLKGDRFGHYS